MGQHDLSYRLFFSHVRMVCDLLREMIGEAWVERIDFASAERINTSFVSDKRRSRESDVIWKFRRRDTGDPVYVYVLLEFQSRPDRYMPVRLMTYVGLLYEHLVAEGKLGPSGQLPQVIPIVVYNGIGPWGTPLDLAELVERFDPSAAAYVPHLRYKLVHEAAYGAEELEKKRAQWRICSAWNGAPAGRTSSLESLTFRSTWGQRSRSCAARSKAGSKRSSSPVWGQLRTRSQTG